jgi:hypothetical protein
VFEVADLEFVVDIVVVQVDIVVGVDIVVEVDIVLVEVDIVEVFDQTFAVDIALVEYLDIHLLMYLEDLDILLQFHKHSYFDHSYLNKIHLRLFNNIYILNIIRI